MAAPEMTMEMTAPPTFGTPGPGLGETAADLVAQEDLTGKLLGNRYQIVAKVGQGGMGVVYRADHT